jgi:hypothetical protein
MTTSFSEVVELTIKSFLKDVFTSAIGRIHSYNSATQIAEVELCVKRPIEDEEEELTFEDYPILQDVKICFPQAGVYSITFPIAKGDSVIVHFMQSDSSKWRDTGEVPSPPPVLRPHSVGYAFAVPCVAPDTSPLLAAAESAMVLTGDEVRLGDVLTAACDAVALATAVSDELTRLQGEYDSHTHVAPGGGGATGPPSALLSALIPTWPKDMGSPNVKAKK